MRQLFDGETIFVLGQCQVVAKFGPILRAYQPVHRSSVAEPRGFANTTLPVVVDATEVQAKHGQPAQDFHTPAYGAAISGQQLDTQQAYSAGMDTYPAELAHMIAEQPAKFLAAMSTLGLAATNSMTGMAPPNTAQSKAPEPLFMVSVGSTVVRLSR